MTKAVLTALFATSAVAGIVTCLVVCKQHAAASAAANAAAKPPSTLPPVPQGPPGASTNVSAPMYQQLYVWQGASWQLVVDGWVQDATPQSFLDYLANDVPPTYAVLYLWDGTSWSTSRNF